MPHLEKNQAFLTPDVYSRCLSILPLLRECSVCPFFQKPRQFTHLIGQAGGFILLEVLVAMSIVASSWIVLEGSYYRLVLKMAQIQVKKAAINGGRDQYEVALFTAMQSDKQDTKVVLNESSGMSRRSRRIPHSGGSVNQK